MILAQLTPDMVKELAPFLVSLGALIWITNEGVKLARSLRGKPGKPPNESLGLAHEDLKRRVDVVEDDVSDIKEKMVGSAWFQKIDAEINGVQRQNEEYRQNKDKEDSRHRHEIYAKIDDVRKELKADLTAQTNLLSQRFEDMPNKLINLLKNTGAIGKKE